MPEVHFEVIRLEDIGKDIISPTSSKQENYRSFPKLSDADVVNLKHYLHRYNQPSTNIKNHKDPIKEILSPNLTKQSVISSSHHHHHHHHHQHQHQPRHEVYADITDDFYSNKLYTDINEPFEQHSQPLTDIYRYHHHYRRHHQHTKQAHETITSSSSSALPNDYQTLGLEYATCGMKKNTRLPVPFENFSLLNGCFGDDAGFTMQFDQQNFIGIYYFFPFQN